MRRFQDWQKRMEEAIESARSKPFSWREHNCALFAADVVTAMTGEPLAEYRGRHGFAVYREQGVAELARRVLGEPLQSVLLAQRGDVVLTDTQDGPGLGICVGRSCAFTGVRGLEFVPLKDCRMAWRV